MLSVKIEGERELSIKLGEIGKGMKPQLRKATLESLILVENTVKHKLTNDVLNIGQNRGGSLRRSITHKMNAGGDIGGIVGTNIKYARIHELGGDIKARNVKFLTIPFRGVVGRARDFQNTFIAKNIIFQRIGKNINPLFVLKSQVTIPKRPYMAPSLQENVSKIENIFNNRLHELLA